jgi:hypothetical protein
MHTLFLIWLGFAPWSIDRQTLIGPVLHGAANVGFLQLTGGKSCGLLPRRKISMMRMGPPQEVAAGLDKVKDFHPEGSRFWNWLAPRQTRPSKKIDGFTLNTALSGSTVLGSLALKGKALLVTVNSVAGAVKVEGLVTEAAGERIKRPQTTIRTVEQMMDEERSEQPQEGADEIPPEIARQIAHEYMDTPYRETLNALLISHV